MAALRHNRGAEVEPQLQVRRQYATSPALRNSNTRAYFRCMSHWRVAPSSISRADVWRSNSAEMSPHRHRATRWLVVGQCGTGNATYAAQPCGLGFNQALKVVCSGFQPHRTVVLKKGVHVRGVCRLQGGWATLSWIGVA